MKSHKEFKPTLIILGERIYHHRVLKNKTTKEIASLVSLSPEAYRNIEKGVTDPSLTKLLLIAQVLNIKCTDLISNLSPDNISVSLQ